MSDRTGGPAYPIPIAGCTDGGVYNTLEQSGGRNGGMTLRDHFAGLAMQAILSGDVSLLQEVKVIAAENGCSYESVVAHFAYAQADAMLAERAERDRC